VDRLEELFTLCEDDPTRRSFLDNLLGLVQVPGGEHALVLIVRSDSASRVARTSKWQTLSEPAQVLMAPPTSGELREMIVKPAELVGLKFEEGLIDSLLNDLLGEPAPLLLLQFTLLGLWDNRSRNRITWE